MNCWALPSGGGKGLKVRSFKDKLKLMFELSVQETPATNWMESSPVKSTKNLQRQIWMENSKDLHLCVQEPSNYWQPEQKLQILGSKKEMVWLGDLDWVVFKSLRSKSNVLDTYNRTNLWKSWGGKWNVLVRAWKYVYQYLVSLSTFSGWNDIWKYLKCITYSKQASGLQRNVQVPTSHRGLVNWF